MKLLPDGSLPQGYTQPWARQAAETSKAYAAFEIYRLMAADRSLTKVGERLGISRQAVEKWSRRYDWRLRVLSWDRHEARTVDEATLLGAAKARERELQMAVALDERTSLRLSAMGPEEVAGLSTLEMLAMMRTSTEMKSKVIRDVVTSQERTGRFDGDGHFLGFDAPPLPTFVIQTIPERPQGYVYVRFGDDPERDGWTWIKEEEVPEYRRLHPEHIVIA